MGHPQRESSSWEDGTGAASGGTISLGSCRSTLEWRNKKVSGRLLGTLIYSNLPGSPPPVRSAEISFLQLSCQGTSTPLEWLRSNAKLRSFCLDGSSLVPVRGLRATPFSPPLFNLCTLVRTATKQGTFSSPWGTEPRYHALSSYLLVTDSPLTCICPFASTYLHENFLDTAPGPPRLLVLPHQPTLMKMTES